MKTLMPELDFSTNHGRENKPENEQVYIDNMPRLNLNAEAIFYHMLKGEKISGVDCQAGLWYKGVKRTMSEYRKRFQEIATALKVFSISIQEEKASTGVKSKFLKAEDREFLLNKMKNAA